MFTFTKDDIDNANAFQVHPPGNYLAEVADINTKQTSKGDDMAGVFFKRVDTGEPLCWDNIVFSEKGKGIAGKKLQRMGALKDQGGGVFVKIPNTMMIGLRVRLDVIVEVYQGKERNIVDFNALDFGYSYADSEPASARSAPSGAPPPLEDEEDDGLGEMPF